MADVNLGVLLSTTLKNYRSTLVDNIFKSNAVFMMLKEKGAVKELDGGERIVQPLMYGKDTTAGSYSGYDPLDTTPQVGIDAAEYNWKQYAVSITISGEEERKNAGSKTRIIDLLEAKTNQAELSLREKLGEGLFSDGPGKQSKLWLTMEVPMVVFPVQRIPGGKLKPMRMQQPSPLLSCERCSTIVQPVDQTHPTW